MGKPILHNCRMHCLEYIEVVSDTERIETSKYLQEKKPKGIPAVAASEKGKG